MIRGRFGAFTALPETTRKRIGPTAQHARIRLADSTAKLVPIVYAKSRPAVVYGMLCQIIVSAQL